MLAMFLSGIATSAVSVNKFLTAEDSLSRHKLIIHDTMQVRYHYTDALKKFIIERDTAAAMALFNESLMLDSTYAPALYQKAAIYHRK